MRYHLTPIRMVMYFFFFEDVEKLEPLYTAGTNQNVK